MSNGTTVNEVVQVAELSRYGFKTAKGVYVNWSKGTKQADKDKVVPGAVFEMELYVSDKGAHYVNSVGKQMDDVPGAVPSVITPKLSQTHPPTVGRDFDKEARGKTRCALLQGLLANSALDLATIDQHFPMIERAVAFVFGDK